MITATLYAVLFALTIGDIAVTGTVRDASGAVLADAIVYVRGSVAGSETAVSDQHGRFALTVPQPGPSVIVVFLAGFKPREIALEPDSESRTLDVVLDPAGVTESVTVVAMHRARVLSEQELKPLDIVRTTGVQADPLRALQSLPGVVKIDDGTGLFVRGGDATETRILLDSMPLFHPYRYETPTGGMIGTVEPFLLESLTFMPGGFPARFGNAIGAVVDMRGLSRPTSVEVAATTGLAAMSGRVAAPLGERAGVRLSANRLYTGALFALNDPAQRFTHNPSGWDLNAAAYYAMRPVGSVKLFAMTQHDRVGVEAPSGAFTDFLEWEGRNRLVNLQWHRSIGRWSASGLVSQSRYVRRVRLGVVTLDTVDQRTAWRGDFVRPGNQWVVRFGSDGSHPLTGISGLVPIQGGDFGGVGGTTTFDVRYDDVHAGTYVEAERLTGRIQANLGLRVDRFAWADALTVDPRVNLVVPMSAESRIRVAWGIYHQAAVPEYLDSVRGAERLDPMRARHIVVGYESSSREGGWSGRLEAYHKRYESLPVEDPNRGYASVGYGHAYGFEVSGLLQQPRGEVKAAYSWVHARRRWTPHDEFNRYPLPPGTWAPDFDVPHTIQLGARVDVTTRLSIGASWRAASGVPFTPVVAASPAGTSFTPIFGAINSERMPSYQRLDLSTSHITRWHRNMIVLFVGMNNVLGRNNVFEYAYSRDYQEHYPVASGTARAVYFGVSLAR